MKREPDPAIVARWSVVDADRDSPARLLWDAEWRNCARPEVALPWEKADDAMRKAWARWVLRSHRAAKRDLARR